MKKENAEIVHKLMREYIVKLDDSIRLIMDNDSPEVFQTYRRAAGRIMGEMCLEIMEPIYKEHPELMPDELKTPDELDTPPKPGTPKPR